MVNVWKTDWVYRDEGEEDMFMWVSMNKGGDFGLLINDFSIFKLNQGELLILEATEVFLS